MNPDDTIRDGPDPVPESMRPGHVPTPADLLRELGSACDEVHQLREENAALNGALKLLHAAHETQLDRLGATLFLRTQQNRKLIDTLNGIAREALPILERYVCELSLGELPDDEAFCEQIAQRVFTLIGVLRRFRPEA